MYPITNRVVIDGVEAPSTGEELSAGNPIVLDGLSLQWGRQTNVDQPDVGTCTFSMREQLNTPANVTPMLDVIHTGSKVEVWAKAEIPASNSETMSRTGFAGLSGDLDPNWWTHDGGTSAISKIDVATRQGRRAAWVTSPTESLWSSGIMFPPAAFEPVGINPDAWDLIPRMLPGQEWVMQVSAWIPPGAGAKLIAHAYTEPTKDGVVSGTCKVVNDLNQPVTVPADGAWHALSARVSLPAGFDADGAWIVPGLLLDPMPSQKTIGSLPGLAGEQPFTYDDYARAGISLVSLVTQGPSVRDVLVWAGEVTSAVGKSAGTQAIQIDVTASDEGATLANTTVSSDPLPKQALSARVTKIKSLATGIGNVSVDSTLNSYQLTYRELAAQPVLDLLKDIADSVGGVMWVATHATTGPYLWMEDPQNRVPLRRFMVDGSDHVTIGGNTRDVSIVSAGDMLLDPVQWTQDVQQVTTSVDVTWQQQGTDTDGTPTADAQTVTRTDDTAVTTYGLRKMTRDTELTTATDANNLADRLLSQARGSGWVVSGLTIDTQLIQRDLNDLDQSSRLSTLMDLLDGTRRLGRGMVLIDLPAWTPSGAAASVYLEGGQYSLSRGHWTLELLASPANSGGQSMSATFNDFTGTGVTVADFDNTITITDAYGVAGPVAA